MKGIILAAGASTRMRPLTNEVPKCLLPVGGKPILQRMIENVFAAGVQEIGLVAGYKAEPVRSFIKSKYQFERIRFIVNPKFAETNNAFSLLMAREFYRQGKGGAASRQQLLLLDSDIVFSPQLLKVLVQRKAANSIAVRVKGAHDEEEVRVQVDSSAVVVRIGKDLPIDRSFGESVGIEVFSPAAAELLFDTLERRVRHGNGRTEFYEAAFQEMIDAGERFQAVDVSDFPVQEIDTPQDLEIAEKEVIPKIEAAASAIPYGYKQSLKSDVSDELINTYLLRPLAGLIVGTLYYTPVTPNQLTIASMLAGLAAAFFYARADAPSVAIAGLLVTLKDLLDSADGQLARARRQFSRLGRFLDSLVDFVVDVAVFGSIGWGLFRTNGSPWMLLMALLALIGISLRVSYHVFYQAAFLHGESKYGVNRLVEEITEEDKRQERLILRLQQIFQVIYGWQDTMMVRIDRWCRRGIGNRDYLREWYSDVTGLRISGFLGFGTELFVLTLCSLFNRLELYLFINLTLMNAIMIIGVVYRRMLLSKRLQSGPS